MKKVRPLILILAIIFSISLCGWAALRIVNAVSFDINCEQYLKRAADANSVEMAKKELEQAILYAESNGLTEGRVSIFLNQPKNDIGFWYENMKTSYEELEKLPEDASALEKTNVLMKLRESLTDANSKSVKVTLPEGISIYPNNVLYFWWSIISLLASIIFWIVYLYQKCHYY